MRGDANPATVAFPRAASPSPRPSNCSASVSRFVHISSPSVYASRDDLRNVREDDPQTPYALNDYVATKRIAEQVVRAGGVPYAILRPRAIFGPGIRLSPDEGKEPFLERAREAVIALSRL